MDGSGHYFYDNAPPMTERFSGTILQRFGPGGHDHRIAVNTDYDIAEAR